jgi:hypothetical protein
VTRDTGAPAEFLRLAEVLARAAAMWWLSQQQVNCSRQTSATLVAGRVAFDGLPIRSVASTAGARLDRSVARLEPAGSERSFPADDDTLVVGGQACG